MLHLFHTCEWLDPSRLKTKNRRLNVTVILAVVLLRCVPAAKRPNSKGSDRFQAVSTTSVLSWYKVANLQQKIKAAYRRMYMLKFSCDS